MDYSIIDWKKLGDHTILNMCGCIFSVQDYPDEDRSEIKFRILNFECNGVFLNCKDHNIMYGPFWIKLNHSLNIRAVIDATYNKEDRILYINNNPYKIIDTDFVYFIGDFHADEKQAIDSIMEYFVQDLIKDKVL